MEIYFLGAFRANRNGEKVSIPRRKTLALFAYLVVTNQPHTREALMTLLWPEDDSGIARSNLRRVLSELNVILGKGFFSIQRDQVGLNPQLEIYVDVNDFKHKVIKARQHQHSSQVGCQECLADLTNAVDLYSGDLLAGFSLPDSRAFDEWHFFESESLHQLLSECLQTLVNWHTNLGNFDRAVEYARRFLALDPLHEPAHRMLMHLYALSGRQAAAIRQYQECVQLLLKEVGVKPEQETIALYEAIRSRKIVSVAQQLEIQPPLISSEDKPPGGPPHNLARTSTPLIGRKDELAEILRLIGTDSTCRLLTLAGPGGSGKTRLAIEAATLLAEDPTSPHRHGIWFISLTPVSTAKGILDKIAQILNLPIPEGGEQTRRMLLDFLRPKRMVLLLDNFEHLMDDQSIGLVMEILAAAPDIKILLTSRERLQIRDEQIIQLAGLQTLSESAWLAGNNNEAVSSEAVQFFAQCAARIKAGFDINPDNLPAVSQICRLVEGMPLGIELAAAWVDVLSPAEIAAEIERSLDFLEADWRDLPERQHSLRAVFESSWSLITEPERQVLIALSVFQGGFTRLSAESTTGVSLKMLLALVHKSWLSQAETGRYSIHELLRQYLSEKLCANPAVYQKLMENYSSYYAGFLEGQAVVMRSSKQRQALEAVALEYENILIAWEWFVEQKQVPTAVERMLPALFFFCTARHKEIEFSQVAAHAGRNFQAVELESTYPVVPPILFTAQCTSSFLGFPNYPDIANPPLAVQEPLHKAWSLAGTRETLPTLGFWGIELAYFYGRGINRGMGIETLRWISDHFRRHDQPWEEALALSYLGTLLENGVFTRAEEEQMLDESHKALSEAVKIFDSLGDMLECGLSLGVLGNLCNRRNDRQQAIQYWLSAREKLQQGGDRSVAAHMLVQIGEAYMATCEFDSGFEYFQKGARELLEMGYVTFAAIVVSKEALHASRYSSLEHARRARRQSIELSNQNNDTFGIAWHTWEMGELCRLEGDVLSARQWYDRASLAENTNEIGPIFYQRGLGDLAYMAGSFTEALGYFQESLRLAEQIRHDWAAAYALVGIGRIETRLGQFNAASDRFRQAYQMARKMENMEMMLVALGGFASLCAASGESEQAVHLARLVLQQRRAWNETKTQAAEVLHRLGIGQSDDLVEEDCVCSSSVVELDEVVSNIEVQFTSRWRINCT